MHTASFPDDTAPPQQHEDGVALSRLNELARIQLEQARNYNQSVCSISETLTKLADQSHTNKGHARNVMTTTTSQNIIRPHAPTPSKFSGSEKDDLALFEQSLNNHFALTDMSDAQKVSYVRLLLDGPALRMVMGAPECERDTYEKIMSTLAKYFSKSAAGGHSLRNLLGRRMKAGESLYDYYNDLLAYCDHASIKEEVSRVAFFINGLDDSMGNFVTAAKPKTMHEAYNIASSLHSNSAGPAVNMVAAADGQRPRPRSAGPDRTGTAIVSSNITCWTCGETNHIARYCPTNNVQGQQYQANGGGNQTARTYYPRQNAQGTYQGRTQSSGQSFPGPHNVRQPTAGANPFCNRCGVAHAFGSHTRPFNNNQRPQQQQQQARPSNFNSNLN